jgi:hypothetical protein
MNCVVGVINTSILLMFIKLVNHFHPLGLTKNKKITVMNKQRSTLTVMIRKLLKLNSYMEA